MHGVEDLGLAGRFLDEQHKIGFFQAFYLDGADPLLPDAEVADRNAGDDPRAVR
jgi:hypothetical protein